MDTIHKRKQETRGSKKIDGMSKTISASVLQALYKEYLSPKNGESSSTCLNVESTLPETHCKYRDHENLIVGQILEHQSLTGSEFPVGAQIGTKPHIEPLPICLKTLGLPGRQKLPSQQGFCRVQNSVRLICAENPLGFDHISINRVRPLFHHSPRHRCSDR